MPDLKGNFQLAKKSFIIWKDENPFLIGAAISFFVLFSLAPILVIIADVLSFILGSSSNAENEISSELAKFIGKEAAGVLQSIIQKGDNAPSQTITLLVSIPMVITGSTLVFIQLRNALNIIWKVDKKKNQTDSNFFKDYFYAFVMVFIFGVIIFVLVLKTPLLILFGNYLSEVIPVPNYVFRILDFLITFTGITFLFAAIYKILPEVEVYFPDVLPGAAFTAFLFSLANIIIGLYLQFTNFTSAYGAMGSFTILFIWIYYSALVFLYGAVFTKEYAMQKGSLSNH